MCPTTTALPPTTTHTTIDMTRDETQLAKRLHNAVVKAMQEELSPEEAKRRQLFYQKMAYIEMKKLRPKHPHA